jgi:hypothetical protein
MQCPICKLENPPEAILCDCGYNFQTRTRQAPVPQQTTSLYRGVGGWLAFFILTLGVFNPLYSAYNLYTGLNETRPAFDQYPGLRTIIYADTAVSAALMGFSIYAAIALLRIQPNAVRIAKTYLVVFLIYALVSPFAVFLAGLPDAANEAMMGAIIPELVRPVIYFAIWFSYLTKSERVKATYPG